MITALRNLRAVSIAIAACILSFPAWSQNFPPQVPISQLPPGGAVQSGDLFPANRAGVTYGVTWPPAAIPLTALSSQSANIMIGTISIGPPTAIAMPSCSGSTSALIWTTGAGIGCHSINAVGIPMSGLMGATTTNAIDNVNAAQSWTWNSLTTQTALSLSSSSETTGKILSLGVTTSGSSGYAGYFSMSGTGNTGYAGYFTNSTTTGYAVYASGSSFFSGTTTLTNAQVTGGAINAVAIGASTSSTAIFRSTTAGSSSIVGNETVGGTEVFSNHVANGGSAPTVASGATACGTSPSISGSDQAGAVTVGTAPSGSCPVTFTNAWTNAPDTCSCNNNTNASRPCAALSISTTSFALVATTSPFTGGDSLGYTCASHRL